MAFLHHLGIVGGGHNDHRNILEMSMCLDLPEHLAPIDLWHPDIEEEHELCTRFPLSIASIPDQIFKDPLPVLKVQDRIIDSRASEVSFDESGMALIILGKKNDQILIQDDTPPR